MIPLSRPDITEKEKKAVLSVLNTTSLSLGPKLEEFERKIAEYIGTKYAIAVNSATSGLHLLVRSMDIKEGDEVITTPFSFVASSNCILFEKAKPVFVDIDPETLNIDVEKIEKAINKKTKAIIAVDVFGFPANYDRLQEIAKKHSLLLIEDSAESLGSEYKGKKCGSFGNAGVFSFYPNKQITTGEGGIIVTNNKKIADVCKSLRNQGRNRYSKIKHDILGYNFRLPEISCALGIVQLSRIDEIIEKRSKVAKLYNSKLSNIDGIKIPTVLSDHKISWFVYVIRVNKNRDKILKQLKEKRIGCSNYFPAIHLQNHYGYKKGSFPVTEKISKSTIALPFYNNLKEKDINIVVENLKKLL
jgi:perosamine synthetase